MAEQTASMLPSVREVLRDMSLQVKRDMPYPYSVEERALHGWQDHGEHVEQAFSVPRGFEDAKTSTLSAELDKDMDKVTVQGSRAGLHFSRSLPLPFVLEEESDIELEHTPGAGLLTLRLRKPKEDDQPPPQPTALAIKRIEDEQGEAAHNGGVASAPQEQAPPAEDAAAAVEPRDGQSEQQALEEKFAFVKQAETREAAAAGLPEAE